MGRAPGHTFQKANEVEGGQVRRLGARRLLLSSRLLQAQTSSPQEARVFFLFRALTAANPWTQSLLLWSSSQPATACSCGLHCVLHCCVSIVQAGLLAWMSERVSEWTRAGLCRAPASCHTPVHMTSENRSALAGDGVHSEGSLAELGSPAAGRVQAASTVLSPAASSV